MPSTRHRCRLCDHVSSTLSRICLLAMAATLLFAATPLMATPPNTPILDGRPTEYDAVDVRGTFVGVPGWPGNVITNLYVTWDQNYLYVALQGRVEGNKFVVLLDVDPDAGTGATTTANWLGAGLLTMEWNSMGWTASDDPGASAFGLDYMIVTEGFFKDILRVRYEGDAVDTNDVDILYGGGGLDLQGTPIEMVVRSDQVSCDLVGFEARIPWSVLYEGDRFGVVEPGEVIPRGATLRLFAHVFNNSPDFAYSSPDVIPEQVHFSASYDNGALVTADYIDIELDLAGDGFPDLAVGDVNAPFIVAASGLSTQTQLYVQFNEPVSAMTAGNILNWQIDGLTPLSVTILATNAALLTTALPLPSPATVVEINAFNIEDSSGNTRPVRFCFTPASTGLSAPVTVEFRLQTASGLGLNPGASHFHINGSLPPLEWGFPPASSAPLSLISTALYARTVIFPPGAGTNLLYKYSGKLNNTGTNNYEIVRLLNFADASRRLGLDAAVPFLTVTDYLGAAGAPWRDPAVITNGHNLIFTDVRRGDAGVRERATVLFQVDLSTRDLFGIARVMVMGSDPLRGFNLDNANFTDFPGGVVDWTEAGIELFDDGTRGDLVAGDGIFSREWVWSVDGKDNTAVPGFPFSLVGGDGGTAPWFGFGWVDRRSYRSFQYRYFVYGPGAQNGLASPASDFDVYLPAGTNRHVMPVHVWANNSLAFAPASNPPEVVEVVTLPTGVKVVFTNLITEGQHSVEVSTNLAGGWANYAQMATGADGLWTTVVEAVSSPEFYRPVSGTVGPRKKTWWTPNPIAATGGPVRVWFHQYSRNVAGRRDVHIHTTIQSDGTRNESNWMGHPMTFAGNGLWYIDFNLTAGANEVARFVFRDGPAVRWDTDWGYVDADQYRVHIGGRATWTPERVLPGESFTITYDAAGGPLEGQTVWIHAGFDKYEGTEWFGTVESVMTPLGGELWEFQLTVPVNATKSAHFLFKNTAQTIWDDYNHPVHWQAFLLP